MSTQELPDDGLDELFRKSAEEFDPPYNPDAWDRLNQRLDDHDRTTGWANWLRWGVPIVLVLLLTGGYLLVKPAKQPVSIVVTPAITNGVDKTSQLPVSQAASASATDVAEPITNKTNTRPSLTTSVPQALRQQHPEGINELTKEVHQANHSPTTLTQRGATNNLRSGVPSGQRSADWDALRPDRMPDRRLANTDVSVLPSNSIDQVNRQPAASKPIAHVGKDNRGTQSKSIASRQEDISANQYSLLRRTRAQEPPQSDKNLPVGPVDQHGVDIAPTASESNPALPEPERLQLAAVSPLGLHAATWPVWPSLTNHAARPEMPARQPVSSRYRPSRLSVQLTVAPDLSTIGLKNFDRPGTNIGLLVQYQFTDRLSAQIGVLRSLKIYQATPEEYDWPASMRWPVSPTGVNGRCTMLDIPLNIRYDVRLHPTVAGYGPSRWFVSGGLTSYVTLRESYKYDYANPDDPKIKFRNWDSPTGQYGFSNLNLSVGYERPFSRHLSWQLEPFVKVPLRPVGYYNVRLISTGAFFSLRYRL